MRRRFLQGAPPPCAARQSTPIKGLSRWADAFWEGDVHAVKSRFGFRTCCWALPHLEPIESEPRLRLSGECAARLRSNRAPCPHLPPASLCVGTGVVRIPCSQELLHGVPRAVTRDPNPKPLNPKLKPVHHAPAIFLLHAVRGQQHLIRRGKPPLGRNDAYWAHVWGARGAWWCDALPTLPVHIPGGVHAEHAGFKRDAAREGWIQGWMRGCRCRI